MAQPRLSGKTFDVTSFGALDDRPSILPRSHKAIESAATRGGGHQPSGNGQQLPRAQQFRPMPAHGFFIRHLKGIVMRDIEIRKAREDFRAGFVLSEVEGGEFEIAAADIKECEEFQFGAELALARRLSGQRRREEVVM
jgi:hypothetical protein